MTKLLIDEAIIVVNVRLPSLITEVILSFNIDQCAH